MEKPLITVSSVTYAMKGQRILASFGIKAGISRSSRRVPEKSCSYTLSVPQDKLGEAIKILKNNGVKVIGSTEGTAKR